MLRNRTRWIRNLLLVAVATGAGLFAGSDRPAEAFPMPDPTYDILAVSNGHEASLLNLGLGMPGAPQVPVPVDVDGDLLPDVTVAVNLLDPVGGIDNPPDVPGLLVPNVEINRILTGTLLGQPVPPLRIEVQLRLVDAFGSEPDTTLRFGYDTGPGGSIPPNFKARLGGIEDFFDPLVATVDTGPSSGRPQTYDGPLRLVGGLDTGDTHVDLGLGFSPLPRQIEVGYGTDDEGQHITYAHQALGLNGREVDARAEIDLESATGETHVDARIDRLPSAIEVDIASPTDSDGEEVEGAGAISWRSSSDGRRPDLEANVTSTSADPDTEPLHAAIDLDSLPPVVHAAWSLPEDGPIDVAFHTGDPEVPGNGQGIGGVDVDISNHPADHPEAVARFLPEQRQYLSVRQEPSADGEVLRRITGRVERIRAGHFSDADGVLAAELSMGDGESPLQVEYACHVECSEDGSTRLVDVDATVSPLPADFTATITDAGEDPRVAPMLIDYTASSPVDVEASIDLAQEGSTGAEIACGSTGTVCADLAVRDLPQELHASLGHYTSPHEEDEVPDEGDLRLAVDLVGQDEAAPIAPDLTAEVVLGPETPEEAPLVAEAEVLDLAPHLRVYLHQHKESTDEGDVLALDRAAFHACVRAVDAPACTEDSAGEIGAVTLSLRSFLDRPDDFPVPLHDRPQYATVTSRPVTEPGAPADARHLEVGARVEHVRDLEYVDTGSLQGIHAAAGDGATPFAARIDIADLPTDDVDLGEDEDGNQQLLTGASRDLLAEAEVTDLPPSFGVCFRTPHEALVEADRAFTERCEESELDGEPLAFAYELAVDEDDTVRVDGAFTTTVEGQLDGQPHAETLDAEVNVPDVPAWVTVQAALPEEDTVGPIDATYLAEHPLDVDFAARMTVNGSRCLDPRPDATAMCVEGYLANIPREARVHYDPTVADDNLRITTSGGGMSLEDLSLSSVSPAPDPLEPYATPDALVVTGAIDDLPASVRGTVVLPGDDGDGDDATELATTMVVCASEEPCTTDADEQAATTDRIGRITLDIANVVAADPTPLGGVGAVPEPRATGLGGITDEILLFQRGDHFHARVDVGGVGGVGYRQVADEDGVRLETDEFLLRFGEGEAPVIRAYADLDHGTERTIADVVLGGVPAATTFCFRGEPNEAAPDQPTWCDEHNTDAGAVQFRATPGADTSGLDVDGFVRHTTGGDAQGISARLRATDLPPVLQGAIPSGDDTSMDVAGFDLSDPAQPQGFGGLEFEAASFDITDHGFTAVPWTRTVGPLDTEVLPAPALAGEHLSVVVTDEEFHARGRLDGLRRIELRDGLCDGLPTGAQGDNPAAYPAYPAEGEYTCGRVEVVGGAAGDPFNVRALARQGDDLVLLDDAGITALPSALQFTLAESEALNPDETLRGACPPLPTPIGDCMAPLVRVDVDGDGGEIFGSLRMGTEAHLEELAQVSPAAGEFGGIEWFDLDQIPALGARVRVGSWGEADGYPEVTPGSAVIAHLRVPLPGSFQLDPPQAWSEADDVDDPTWEASDLRLHYVARAGDGSVIPSLGDLKVLMHTAPTQKQVLLTGGDPLLGAAIPGELAVGVYLRNDVEAERMFVQADGHVSTDVSITATILPGLPPMLPLIDGAADRPPDRIALQVLDLPGSDQPFAGFHAPTFRVQAEIIDDSPPPEECSTTSCSTSHSRLDEVRAVLDLQPDGSATGPARLVQAVVHTLADGPMGVQFAAYEDVNATPTAGLDGNGVPTDGDAEISLWANLALDPLSAYEFSGVPWLANWSVNLDATLDLALSVENVTDFLLFNKTLGTVSNYRGGPNASAYLGPIALRPDYVFAGVEFLGVTLFGFELPPYNSGEVLPLDFPSCDGGAIAAEIVLGDVLGGSAAMRFLDTLPWNDPYEDVVGAHDYGYGVALDPGVRNDRLIFPEINLPLDPGPGLTALGAGVLADLLPGVAHGIGCQAFNLTEIDLINAEHPGVPVGAEVVDHPVPGEVDATPHTVPDVELGPDPDATELHVGDGDGEGDVADDAMCGHRVFPGHLSVEGTLEVATTPGPYCEAGAVGRLDLVAQSITIVGGIDGDGVVTTECGEAPWGSYDHQADGARPTPVGALDNLLLVGEAAACSLLETGGGGAGHSGFGGAGHLGFGGPFYDLRQDAGATTAGYGGGNGNGGAEGGDGGGLVRLIAEEVTVNGSVSVDGTAGDHSTGECDASPKAAGGGSGGGIAVLANRAVFTGNAVLSADGGDGGFGTFAGGGGGAPGDIEVVAGLREGSFTSELTPGGGGGADTDCNPGGGGGAGTFVDLGHVEAAQRSYALPPRDRSGGDIWYTTNDIDRNGDGVLTDDETAVHVPFAASANTTNGMTVALCGVVLSPSIDDYEAGFQALTPEFTSPSDPCGLADVLDLGIARIDTARLIDHAYLPDLNHVSAFDGFDLSVADLSAHPDFCPAFLPTEVQDAVCGVEAVSGYYGLYTVVIRSDIPDNDCLDPSDTGALGVLDDLFNCWHPEALPSNDPANDCSNPYDFPVVAAWEGSGFSAIGVEYDRDHCFFPNIEPPPGDAGPDVIIALDNDAPDSLTVTPTLYDPAQDDGTDVWTRRHHVTGTLEATDTLGTTELDNTSGVAGFQCWEQTPGQDARSVDCSMFGTYTADLTPGDGRKELWFRVFDEVGNFTDFPYDRYVVDTVIPEVELVAGSGPDQPNGWYSVSPELTLTGFTDPPGGSLEAPPHPEGRYRFQIDDGTELSCDGNDAQPGPVDCVLPVTPGPGTHTVWFTAMDRAGNRGSRSLLARLRGRGMEQQTFGIDDDPPVAGVLLAPGLPDGANGWYRTLPFVGIQANDLPVGGAGVDPAVPPSQLDRTVSGPGFSGVAEPYLRPFLLGAGTFSVCAEATDVAGNPDPDDPPAIACVDGIRVDPDPPTVTLALAGPLGGGGWYTGPATVTVDALDLPVGTGSGIDPAAEGSGLFVSVDDGPFVPIAAGGSLLVQEGEHVVRAYAVDVAGNRSAVVERFVDVDRSHPVSELRTLPADPARDSWFRTRPMVVLRATDGDANAGVASIRYCLGTGCTPDTAYTGPFTAPEGRTTIRWQALDVSGSANHEPIRSTVVNADTAPPVAVATSPSKLLWLRLKLLGIQIGQPSEIQLRFTVSDAQTGPLRAQVVIFDAVGNPVRRIDAAPIDVVAGQTVTGSVNWDGRAQGLANLVPLGVYHYRVVVTDQAGNITESGESKPITIKLL